MTYADYLAKLTKLLRDPWPPGLEQRSRMPEEPPRIIEPQRHPEPPRWPN